MAAKVLIVEDDDVIARAMSTHLAAGGFELLIDRLSVQAYDVFVRKLRDKIDRRTPRYKLDPVAKSHFPQVWKSVWRGVLRSLTPCG